MKGTRVIVWGGLYLSCSVLLLFSLLSPSLHAPPKTHTVEISQMKFSPDKLLVKKGDKVIFINKDMVTHDITEASGKSWRSPALATGKSWSMAVTQNMAYFCSFHPVMKGRIRIK